MCIQKQKLIFSQYIICRIRLLQAYKIYLVINIYHYEMTNLILLSILVYMRKLVIH